MKIHKGDTVKIISGKDRGKSGKVIKVLSDRNAIIVDGINTFKKHRRPKKQGEKGEIVTVVRPFAVSNAMLICSSCKEATRVGYKIEGEKKFRYCKKCGSQT